MILEKNFIANFTYATVCSIHTTYSLCHPVHGDSPLRAGVVRKSNQTMSGVYFLIVQSPGVFWLNGPVYENEKRMNHEGRSRTKKGYL
jgi:hypothetical protein